MTKVKTAIFVSILKMYKKSKEKHNREHTELRLKHDQSVYLTIRLGLSGTLLKEDLE